MSWTLHSGPEPRGSAGGPDGIGWIWWWANEEGRLGSTEVFVAGTLAEVPAMLRKRPWAKEAIDTEGRCVIDRLVADGGAPPKKVTFYPDRTVSDPYE